LFTARVPGLAAPVTALAAALAMTLAAPQVRAHDPEIEALKHSLNELQQRLQRMEAQYEQRELPPPATSAGAAGLPFRLAISGQINRALLWTDDGQERDLFHVDNNASSSRLRFIAEPAQPAAGLSLGAAFEFEFRVNNSFTVSQADERLVQGGSGASNFRDRRAEVWIASRFGTLWIGKGWTASEGASERDLSGTGVAGYSDPGVMGGGMRFRDEAGIDGNPRVFDVLTNMDGRGRDIRLRYDTPSLPGTPQLRLSAIQGGTLDGALFYDKALDAGRLAAAIAYADIRPTTPAPHQQLASASVSFLFDNGVSLSGAAGQRWHLGENADRKAGFTYLKLGYQRSWWALGKTALSIDYQQTRDLMQRDDRASAAGFQLVQHLERWNSDLFLNARTHDLHRTDARFDDIRMIMAGARVRF
jgi:hypothetical protein